MSITAENEFGDPQEFARVLDWLKHSKVVSVKPQPDGNFRVREECDAYFSKMLTREQLLMLADELRALAGEGTT